MIEFKEIAYRSQDWKSAVQLREAVLRAPLGAVFTEEELAEEAAHIQIAGFKEEKLVTCAVLVPDGPALKMQRVAVDEQLRNQAIGSKMMDFCEAWAIKRNIEYIYCHARDSAVNFYLNNAYQPEGDYFDEDGIPHLKMKKHLASDKH